MPSFKQFLTSALLIASSTAVPLSSRQGVRVSLLSPTAPQIVANAISEFTQNTTLVTSALVSLQDQIESEETTSITSTAFSAQLDLLNPLGALSRFAGDFGLGNSPSDIGISDSTRIRNSGQKVLNCLQLIINSPFPGKVIPNVQEITEIRNVDLFPSFTRLANITLANIRQSPTAPIIPPLEIS
ncbi:hypothetical protein BKA64DRAFT_646622 [Cadophora sp. MPI-SDFR-AT-0126]|nr:hypothetical protein BKA64DRAFT_646622 [Leotiomycetes sp. MPI-SDFR-AT-0126]